MASSKAAAVDYFKIVFETVQELKISKRQYIKCPRSVIHILYYFYGFQGSST